MSAATSAKTLVTDLKSAMSSVKASPTSYGPSALTSLAAALDAAQFTTENVPSQVNSAQDLTKGLVKCAQINKIEVPSQAGHGKRCQRYGKRINTRRQHVT